MCCHAPFALTLSFTLNHLRATSGSSMWRYHDPIRVAPSSSWKRHIANTHLSPLPNCLLLHVGLPSLSLVLKPSTLCVANHFPAKNKKKKLTVLNHQGVCVCLLSVCLCVLASVLWQRELQVSQRDAETYLDCTNETCCMMGQWVKALILLPPEERALTKLTSHQVKSY